MRTTITVLTQAVQLPGPLREAGTGGNLTHDPHLAALGLELDATVVTFDSDFARSKGVKWWTPETPASCERGQ
ncbi:MAG: hypothetical protein LBC97_13580 [Bifidobacteriaceae bacterium]|jgi:predicted nucleic acid-binding protein|nr:hypothetical protein [Bifidobacteriaceae bacterium]